MRSAQRSRRDQAHLVTEARPGLSADIAFRERRYLIMMGIRTLCFITALLMFVNHLGWLTAIPAAGALVIPYFAVVFANGGREPTVNRAFRPYEPSLPEVYRRQDGAAGEAQKGSPFSQNVPPSGAPTAPGSDQDVPPSATSGSSVQ